MEDLHCRAHAGPLIFRITEDIQEVVDNDQLGSGAEHLYVGHDFKADRINIRVGQEGVTDLASGRKFRKVVPGLL